MPGISIMVKPASGLCNLRCKYCFYKDVAENREQQSYGMMSLQTLEQIIKKTLDYAEGECSIVFQGGEPTLAGLDFFKAVVEFEKKYNYKKLAVHNSIQTNGYILDEEWAAFLSENNFLVGLSIDGTKDTHDTYRVDVLGNGTHKRIMQSVNLLKKHEVEFNVLTVVNAKTAKHITSIYNFFMKNNLKYLQFIPCLDPIGTCQGETGFSLTSDKYENFLKNLFDLWYRDMKRGNYVYIRYFENLVGMLIGYPPETCGMAGVCTRQYVFEADGGAYPCDFYVLDEHILGNINSDSYEELDGKRDRNGFIACSKGVHEKCRSCQYFSLCRGGCRRNREPLIEGNLGENVFCEAFHGFFEYSYPRLQELASMAMQNMRKG